MDDVFANAAITGALSSSRSAPAAKVSSPGSSSTELAKAAALEPANSAPAASAVDPEAVKVGGCCVVGLCAAAVCGGAVEWGCVTRLCVLCVLCVLGLQLCSCTSGLRAYSMCCVTCTCTSCKPSAVHACMPEQCTATTGVQLTRLPPALRQAQVQAQMAAEMQAQMAAQMATMQAALKAQMEVQMAAQQQAQKALMEELAELRVSSALPSANGEHAPAAAGWCTLGVDCAGCTLLADV